MTLLTVGQSTLRNITICHYRLWLNPDNVLAVAIDPWGLLQDDNHLGHAKTLEIACQQSPFLPQLTLP